MGAIGQLSATPSGVFDKRAAVELHGGCGSLSEPVAEAQRLACHEL